VGRQHRLLDLQVDTTTSGGRLARGILTQFAEFESDER
jgi:DNA invertase Pin-like site-specific DNA recombinase